MNNPLTVEMFRMDHSFVEPRIYIYLICASSLASSIISNRKIIATFCAGNLNNSFDQVDNTCTFFLTTWYRELQIQI